MPGLAERALRIIRERYADFGPTLACEKLAEVHGLYLAKETVRKLIEDGLFQAELCASPLFSSTTAPCSVITTF